MPDERRQVSEARLFALARLVCVGVILVLIAFVVVAHPEKPIDDTVLFLDCHSERSEECASRRQKTDPSPRAG